MKTGMFKNGISYFGFRVIAMVTMVIDHLAAIVFSSMDLSDTMRHYLVTIPRYIGRLSMPVFAFFVAEGVLRTHNIKKYLFRLFVLSLIAEVPHDLANYGVVLEFKSQNTVFSLLAGALFCVLYEKLKSQNTAKRYMLLTAGISLGSVLCELLNLEYQFFTPLLILAIYIFSDDYLKMFYASAISFFTIYPLRSYLTALKYGKTVSLLGMLNNVMLEALGLISLYLIACYYNRNKGRNIPKILSYSFYPLQFLLIYLIKILVV